MSVSGVIKCKYEHGGQIQQIALCRFHSDTAVRKLVLNQQSILHSETIRLCEIHNTLQSTDCTAEFLLIFQSENCIFFLDGLPTLQAFQTREIMNPTFIQTLGPEMFLFKKASLVLPFTSICFQSILRSDSKFSSGFCPGTTLKTILPHHFKRSSQFFSCWSSRVLSSVLSPLGCIFLHQSVSFLFLQIFFSFSFHYTLCVIHNCKTAAFCVFLLLLSTTFSKSIACFLLSSYLWYQFAGAAIQVPQTRWLKQQKFVVSQF